MVTHNQESRISNFLEYYLYVRCSIVHCFCILTEEEEQNFKLIKEFKKSRLQQIIDQYWRTQGLYHQPVSTTVLLYYHAMRPANLNFFAEKKFMQCRSILAARYFVAGTSFYFICLFVKTETGSRGRRRNGRPCFFVCFSTFHLLKP